MLAARSGGAERDGQGSHASRDALGAIWRESSRGLGRLAGGSGTSGAVRPGNGRDRNRARTPLNWASQGQRWGRCKVRRRAERVSRPAIENKRRRQLAPTRSARDTSCLPPVEFRPSWTHGRHHHAGVAALTPPSSPSIGIWLGPFAFPYPSSLVSTTRTSRFGGFGLNNNRSACSLTSSPARRLRISDAGVAVLWCSGVMEHWCSGATGFPSRTLAGGPTAFGSTGSPTGSWARADAGPIRTPASSSASTNPSPSQARRRCRSAARRRALTVPTPGRDSARCYNRAGYRRSGSAPWSEQC